jgi:uncharacterized membrane protein
MPQHKTWSIKHDLLLIIGLGLLLALAIALGNQGWAYYPRAILGLPFVLGCPGYTFVVALFPRRGDLGGIDRFGLSLGLSIVIDLLIGLLLNYTPWGIQIMPVLISLLVFVIFTSAIALYRRSKLPVAERFAPIWEFDMPFSREVPLLERILFVMLILSIILVIAGIGYIVVTPIKSEAFTEFYMLGPDGTAGSYPANINVGEKAQVTLGIVNHEHELEDYHVEVMMGQYPLSKTGPILLDNEQKWQGPATFSATQPYHDLKVEFLLFRNGDNTPYQSLDLWVNVLQPAAGVAAKPPAPTPTL